MQHFFIVNPAAGSQNFGSDIQTLLNARPDVQGQIYLTAAPGDATQYVQDICAKLEGAKRFWACGGDGTLNEVLNGMVGCPDAQLACWPSGSGNDFVKYYGGRDAFFDFDAQLQGEAVPVDIMEAAGRYSINVINFGFDTVAAQVMQKVKRLPLLGNGNAYWTGAAYAFVTAMKNKCTVYADGELLNPEGHILFCTAACGQFIGGQFRCAPRSINNDGLMDICLIKPLSRLRAFTLIKLYEKGGHLDSPRMQDILVYRRAKELTLQAGDNWVLTLDGEMIPAATATIRILPGAVPFVVPKGAHTIM